MAGDATVILLPIVTAGISLLNASAFLLLLPGADLQAYLLCSSVHATTSWISGWVLPAAVGYNVARMREVRVMQLVALALAVTLLLALERSLIGLLFILLMVIDSVSFPSAMLLFHSKTREYLLMDLMRNLANSLFLAINLLTFGGVPALHAGAGVLIAGMGVGILWLLGWHRPPAYGMANLAEMRAVTMSASSHPQFRALIAARGIEIGAVSALNARDLLPIMLSLRLGLALSTPLAAGARHMPLAALVAVFSLVYGALVLGIVGWAALDIRGTPATLHLVSPASALLAYPVALACFSLTVLGLRAERAHRPCGLGKD